MMSKKKLLIYTTEEHKEKSKHIARIDDVMWLGELHHDFKPSNSFNTKRTLQAKLS